MYNILDYKITKFYVMNKSNAKFEKKMTPCNKK